MLRSGVLRWPVIQNGLDMFMGLWVGGRDDLELEFKCTYYYGQNHE
jgi:hypothetical protein